MNYYKLLGLRFVDLSSEEMVNKLLDNYRRSDKASSLVTPNVDHLQRVYESGKKRLYECDYVTLDSNILRKIVECRYGEKLKLCTGSDVTRSLLEAIPKDTKILIVGSEAGRFNILCEKFGLTNARQIIPPMGFVKELSKIKKLVRDIEAVGDKSIVFLAVGSPQQEFVSKLISNRGKLRSQFLSIGASIDFLTGVEVRAPRMIQFFCLEWCWRIMVNKDPIRMFKRYFGRNLPFLFRVLFKDKERIYEKVSDPS